MRLTAPLCLVTLSVAAALPGTAAAAESYDGCKSTIASLPAVITTQGVWCMKSDLATAITTGAAITVQASNVIIDCNHFKLGGLAAGPATATYGISVQDRSNLVVRNCNIRGFAVGINAFGGSGHLIEDNRLEGNTSFGVSMGAGNSEIRNNRIVDTGGSTAFPAGQESYGIYSAYENEIVDNRILGVAASGAAAFGYGIFTNNAGYGVVARNHVYGVSGAGGVEAYGIFNLNSGRIVVRDNVLEHGVDDGTAIACSSATGLATGNTVNGYETDFVGCTATGNTSN